MNHKRLREIFQGIYDRFDKMRPTSLEELENETLDAMDELDSYLMDSTLVSTDKFAEALYLSGQSSSDQFFIVRLHSCSPSMVLCI